MARKSRLTFHGALLILIVAVLLAMASAPVRQALEQQGRIRRQEEKLEALEKENARLEHRLERLKDPLYLERLAREELGLVRPGEVSYVVVPAPAPTQTATEASSPPEPWYRRALDWLADRIGD